MKLLKGARNRVAERRPDQLGGSEIAAAIGENPYMTPHDLALVKKGLMTRDANEAMRRGKRLERVFAEIWAEENAREMDWLDRTLVGRGKDDWKVVTPDFGVLAEDKAGTEGGEVKTVNYRSADRWDETSIPNEVVVQVSWAMHLVPAWPRVNVLAFFSRDDIRHFTVERDEEFIGLMVERAERFRRDYLLTDALPPVTKPTELSAGYVKKLFPRDTEPAREATPYENDAALELQEVLRLYDGLEERVELCKQALKASIGDASGIFGDWGRISYKATKGRTTTDWKELATEALKALVSSLTKAGVTEDDALAMASEMATRFTTTSEGGRRFLPSFKGGAAEQKEGA